MKHKKPHTLKGTELMKIFDFENMNTKEKEAYKEFAYKIEEASNFLEAHIGIEEFCREYLQKYRDRVKNDDVCKLELKHLNSKLVKYINGIENSVINQKSARHKLLELACGRSDI